MSKHASISPTEAADRLAIRELVEAYAHCADRRDAKGQMALFTQDTHFVVFMNAKDPKPSMDLHSRDALAPVFADLNKYDATTHFVGQSTIFTLSADRATGEAYCLAHHFTVDVDLSRRDRWSSGGPAEEVPLLSLPTTALVDAVGHALRSAPYSTLQTDTPRVRSPSDWTLQTRSGGTLHEKPAAVSSTESGY